MKKYLIKKALNNNVLIATDVSGNEVVLIGRGIGFGKKVWRADYSRES